MSHKSRCGGIFMTISISMKTKGFMEKFMALMNDFMTQDSLSGAVSMKAFHGIPQYSCSLV